MVNSKVLQYKSGHNGNRALDHKNFETFRAERLDDWGKLNARLESDKFAAEWSEKKLLLG